MFYRPTVNGAMTPCQHQLVGCPCTQDLFISKSSFHFIFFYQLDLLCIGKGPSFPAIVVNCTGKFLQNFYLLFTLVFLCQTRPNSKFMTAVSTQYKVSDRRKEKKKKMQLTLSIVFIQYGFCIRCSRWLFKFSKVRLIGFGLFV